MWTAVCSKRSLNTGPAPISTEVAVQRISALPHDVIQRSDLDVDTSESKPGDA